MNLQQAIDEYLAHLSENNKKQRTINAYQYDFKIVLAFFEPDRALQEITLPQVGKFIRSDVLLLRQDGQPRCQNMVNRIQRVFRMLLFWAYENGHLDFLPIPKSLPTGRNQILHEPLSSIETMPSDCA